MWSSACTLCDNRLCPRFHLHWHPSSLLKLTIRLSSANHKVSYSRKRNPKRTFMRRIASFVLLSWLVGVTLMIALPVQAQASLGEGSFSFTLKGFPIQGQLSNAVLHADGTVTMTMSIYEILQTSIGPLPLSGSGQWYGRVIGGTLWGMIENVTGSIEVCALQSFPLLSCSYAKFKGNSLWVGTLSGSQGNGTFEGVITFTAAPYPVYPLWYQLWPQEWYPQSFPVGQPIPISGTWSSTFQ